MLYDRLFSHPIRNSTEIKLHIKTVFCNNNDNSVQHLFRTSGHMKAAHMFTLPSTTSYRDRFDKIQCVVEKANNDPRLNFSLSYFTFCPKSLSIFCLVCTLKKKSSHISQLSHVFNCAQETCFSNSSKNCIKHVEHIWLGLNTWSNFLQYNIAESELFI